MKRNNVRRLLALVLVAALCLLCGAAAQPNATEIHIYSADDLVQLSKSCKLDTYSQGKTVYLDNDVDLSGSDFVPIPTFGGMFEGQGHTVSGLELSGDASHMGLFRYVQAVGTVRDLKITGNIDAAGTLNEIGAVVGTNYGTISGCSFNGTISGENNVGGIAGTNESSGMVYNCKTEGFVEGDHYVGGLVGQSKGSVRNSFAKSELTGRNYIGGIAGYGMNVSGCNTLVNLNGSGNCVGTIAGEIDPDGSASDNYFVHETEAGIDGISYAGKAEGKSYEAFMARDGIPAEEADTDDADAPQHP